MTLLPPEAPPLLLSPWALGFLPVNLGRTHTFRPWREAHLSSAVDATTCHEVSSLNNPRSRIPCGPVGREPSGQSLWAEIKVSARTALLSGGSWEATHFLASSSHQLHHCILSVWDSIRCIVHVSLELPAATGTPWLTALPLHIRSQQGRGAGKLLRLQHSDLPWRPPYAGKDPCDYTKATCIIQGTPPILKSAD